MSRNQNNLYKNLKLKFSKSLSKSKYESINTSENLINTNNNSGINMQKNEITEINNNRVNTMESIHKPFISLLKVDALTNKNKKKSKNFHIPNLTNLFKSYSKNKKRNLRNKDLSINLTINNSLQQNFKNKNLTTVINNNYNNHSRINSNSPNKNKNLIKKKHIRTNINSPLNRSEILQSELEDKEKIINNLKEILNNKEKIINDLKNEIQTLKNNKNEEDEYEQYSKKIMIRNIKLLTVENNDLRKELEIYKNKEIKIMSILYNLNKNGIPIDDLVNFAQESQINLNNNNNEKSDNITSSNTFIPIYIKSNSNINNFYDIKNDMNIPNLNFDNLNQKYNEDFIQNNNKNNYINNNNNNFIDIGNIKINFNDNQNYVNSPITSSINNSISTTANGYSYNNNLNNNLKKENKEKTKNNNNNNNNNKNKNYYSNKNYIYNSQEIKSNNYYHNKNNINNNNKNNNNNNNKEKNFTNFNVNCNINPKHHNNFSLNQKFKMSKLLEKFK